jgi:hypothetical protein
VAWLEFDHMESDDDPVANVGVCLAPAYLDPSSKLPSQPASELLDTIAETLRVIRRSEPDPDELECFRKCLERLPQAARWIHLSVMAARTPLQLKLYGTFPVDSVIPYLQDVGWAGDPAPVAELLRRYCPWDRTAGTVYVDLPVTGMYDSATAGLGIVFARQQLRVAHHRDPARKELLDLLVADGLCGPDEREGLVQWPSLDGVIVPLDQASDVTETRVERWFDLKLVYQPSGPLLGKAYLGFLARRRVSPDLRPRARDNRRPGASPSPAVAPETT